MYKPQRIKKIAGLIMMVCTLAMCAAKLSDYVLCTDPAGDDYIVGVDISDTTMGASGTTKRFRLRDIPVPDFMDAADELVAMINAAPTMFLQTPSAAPANDYQVANKKYVDDNIPAAGVTAVLGKTGGAVPILFQSFTAVADGDTNPDVSASQTFYTVNTSATTINDFDGTMLADGRDLWVFFSDALTTIALTSSGIEAPNRADNMLVPQETLLHFKYATIDAQWHCVNCPDPVATLSSDGIVVNASGTPYARSMAAGDGITWTNADGVSGNPTPTVAYPFIKERTISDPADADDFYWFRAPAALALASFNCIAEGSSPSITVDLQECDSDGASCASVLSAAVTCNGGNDAGTISDTTVASGAWLRALLGTPSGTVDSVTFTLAGTQ